MTPRKGAPNQAAEKGREPYDITRFSDLLFFFCSASLKEEEETTDTRMKKKNSSFSFLIFVVNFSLFVASGSVDGMSR